MFAVVAILATATSCPTVQLPAQLPNGPTGDGCLIYDKLGSLPNATAYNL